MKVCSSEIPTAKILVVDDQPENLRLLANALGGEGYEVKGVVNGEMALITATKVVPDLILLDVNMPEVDGYQICRRLKASCVTQDIPIIFLSASNESVDRIKGLSVGGVDFINKPFQVDEVLLRIKNQLQLQIAQKEILKLNLELEQRIKERTVQLEDANHELIYEIQERSALSRLLQESEERLESILNSLEEVVWSADCTNNSLLFLNPAAQKVYGRPVEELLSNPNLRLDTIHPEDRDRVKVSLASSLPQINNLEYRIVQPSGEVRWVWERSRLIYDNSGVVNRRDGIISDVTERKKIEAELSYEAKHDSLTHLPNRAAFIERLELALKQSQQQLEYQFAILFIDLDRFKIVNDSLGHLVGDELLITVAQILRDCSREGDFVARLGGDEFTILLPKIVNVAEGSAIAQRINEQLNTPFSLQGHTVFTSASIGIVVADSHYKTSADILRDADLAMYRAKARGKSRHEIFVQEMYTETKELLKLENDLRKAILEQQFVLHYQPIICLATDKVYGFEALLRWNHPEKGLLYPDRFLSVAEETGLIVSIGEWVLNEACQQMSRWQNQYSGSNELKISVNISSQQLKDPLFLSFVDQILMDTGLNSTALHLEITESTLMDYKSSDSNLFEQIKARNVRLDLDDFGTGYSSLQYLKRFPINLLKIDRSFINGMLNEQENFEIVKMIINLARSLKIKIIAEGIENLKQLKVLKTLNCQLGQGYLFSKPLDQDSARLLVE